MPRGTVFGVRANVTCTESECDYVSEGSGHLAERASSVAPFPVTPRTRRKTQFRSSSYASTPRVTREIAGRAASLGLGSGRRKLPPPPPPAAGVDTLRIGEVQEGVLEDFSSGSTLPPPYE